MPTSSSSRSTSWLSSSMDAQKVFHPPPLFYFHPLPCDSNRLWSRALSQCIANIEHSCMILQMNFGAKWYIPFPRAGHTIYWKIVTIGRLFNFWATHVWLGMLFILIADQTLSKISGIVNNYWCGQCPKIKGFGLTGCYSVCNIHMYTHYMTHECKEYL